MSTLTISILIMATVLLLAIGALPFWRHSRLWGFYPSVKLGLISMMVLLFVLTDSNPLSISDTSPVPVRPQTLSDNSQLAPLFELPSQPPLPSAATQREIEMTAASPREIELTSAALPREISAASSRAMTYQP